MNESIVRIGLGCNLFRCVCHSSSPAVAVRAGRPMSREGGRGHVDGMPSGGTVGLWGGVHPVK